MNILVVGNGFDLAHNLPTQYKDFLKFVNVVNAILKKEGYNEILEQETKEITDKNKLKIETQKIKDFFDFINNLKEQKNFKYIEEINKLSSSNLWINYFSKYLSDSSLSFGKNWIDFEQEISKVVKRLESLNKSKEIYLIENYDKSIDNDVPRFEAASSDIVYLENLDPDIIEKGYAWASQENYYLFSIKYFEYLNNKLSDDLNNLIRCLEIYLSLYINNLETGLRIPEILDLKDKIDCVLSFNYTNTFERFYRKHNVEYDYIHGKANLENTVDSCQLILGIDEYLDEEERNKNIDFIQYKKYFQRIYKKTGCEYKDWLKKIYKYNHGNDSFYHGKKELNIYIIGHSLDITDKDILNELIMFDKQDNSLKENTNVNITIYNHNPEASASHIANLVRIITQDELIDSVYSKETDKNARIEFKPQSDPICVDM